MKKIKCIIVDDEPLAVSLLRKYVEKISFSSDEIIGDLAVIPKNNLKPHDVLFPIKLLDGYTTYEKEKFDIVAMRMLEMDDCIASKHYAEHVGKPYYQRLVDFMASDRIVALVVEGENAIERVRELHGKTDPNLAQPGTIRSEDRKSVV